MRLTVFVGYDPREADAYRVCVASLLAHARWPLDVRPLLLPQLQAEGLYRRPMERRGAQLWDAISDAPMSTEFSLTRFLVPYLMNYQGLALFVDCDFLFRQDVYDLVEFSEPGSAVNVVKHVHEPTESTKMDGQEQRRYRRKNWSSLILWDCGHEQTRKNLTLDAVNARRGLDLHQFAWLPHGERYIGEIEVRWNWLEGYSPAHIEPAAVHYTRGVPSMPGYENSAYADEWRSYLSDERSA